MPKATNQSGRRQAWREWLEGSARSECLRCVVVTVYSNTLVKVLTLNNLIYSPIAASSVDDVVNDQAGAGNDSTSNMSRSTGNRNQCTVVYRYPSKRLREHC
jgi:hypothetical protein